MDYRIAKVIGLNFRTSRFYTFCVSIIQKLKTIEDFCMLDHIETFEIRLWWFDHIFKVADFQIFIVKSVLKDATDNRSPYFQETQLWWTWQTRSWLNIVTLQRDDVTQEFLGAGQSFEGRFVLLSTSVFGPIFPENDKYPLSLQSRVIPTDVVIWILVPTEWQI